MIINYFKIAFRNLKKNKIYSVINILGMTIGIVCTTLILLWVSDELNFNKFNKNLDQIFVIPQIQEYQGLGKQTYAATPSALAPSLKSERPEIKYATRYVYIFGTSQVSYNNKIFKQTLNFADPDFFKMFSFDFIKGNKNTVLNDPHSVVITQKMASVYFGNDNPIGKVLRLRDKVDLRVTGVIKEVPRNSDLCFDMISPSELLKEFGFNTNDWGMNMLMTFVQLHNPDQAHGLSRMIAGRIRKEIDSPTIGTLFLFPFKDFHLHSYYFSGTGEKMETIIIFVIIAFLILIIACINFTNLSIVKSAKRAVEVGIRKVIGVSRTQIMLQFFIESLLMTFISLLLSVYLVTVFLPFFNSISGKDLSLSQIPMQTILSILGVTFLTGILSGIYPGIVLSSFQPIKTLKGTVTGIQSKYSLRRVLVVFQFTVSIILIIGTSIVYLQTQYILNKNIGLDKNNIIYISLSEALQNNTESLKTELLKNANIINATVSSGIPTDIFVNSGGWSWEGKDPQQQESVASIGADDDFLRTYGITLSSGRYYQRELAGSNSGSIVINESFAKLTGYNNPIGRTISYGNQVYNIIGVVKDFNFIRLQKKIGPLVIYSGSYPQYLSIKVANSGLNKTLDFIKITCSNF